MNGNYSFCYLPNANRRKCDIGVRIATVGCASYESSCSALCHIWYCTCFSYSRSSWRGLSYSGCCRSITWDTQTWAFYCGILESVSNVCAVWYVSRQRVEVFPITPLHFGWWLLWARTHIWYAIFGSDNQKLLLWPLYDHWFIQINYCNEIMKSQNKSKKVKW